jgi:uncharacterized membrane protein YtjA (UPF0391 family)
MLWLLKWIGFAARRRRPGGRTVDRQHAVLDERPAARRPALRLLLGGTPAALVPPTEQDMLRWALIFAIIAVIAGALGFTGIEAGAADIARLLFYVFVALVVIFLVLGFTIFKR